MKHCHDGQQESNQAELIEITEELQDAQEEAVRKDRHWKQMMDKEREPTKHNLGTTTRARYILCRYGWTTS